MSFIFTYTAVVLTIFFIVTAAFLFLKGKKDTVTTLFILYILSSALWTGGNALADISTTPKLLIIASSIAFFGGTFLVTFFLIFVDTFIDERLPSTEKIILYALPSVLFSIFCFSEYAILDTLFPPNQPAQIIPGAHYYLSLIFGFFGLFYGIGRLSFAFNRQHGHKRLQTMYIAVGFAGLCIGEIIFSVLLPVLGELRFFNVAPQFSVIFIVASGYAIFKHNLLDIRFVIQKGIIYTLLLFLIVSTYLIILNISGIFLNKLTSLAMILSAGITTVIGIFSVPYIDAYLRKKTDRLFFKDKYDYASSLYKLSDTIGKKLVLSEIIRQTELELKQLFKEKAVFVTIFSTNNTKPMLIPQSKFDTVSPMIPICLGDSVLGSIHLGEKLSGDMYTHEDIALLNTFTNQVAVAIENARLFKEVEDYSHELENRVQERTKEIEQLQQREKQLLLDISHNLQNPLTIVKGKLGMIEKSIFTQDELAAFEKSIDDISSFIYALLHFSHFEANQHTLTKERFSISALVEEQAEYYAVITHANGIRLESNIEKDISMYGNKEKIKELLDNLMSNAIKYSDTKKKCKKISISLLQCNTEVSFTITDTGIGIHKDDLPHIFERFYRTKNKSSEHIKGTGLGLAICKKIVEIHHGSIIVESVLGSHTTVSITFKSS